MSKFIHFIVLVLSIFLIGIYSPVQASEHDLVKVVVGFENDAGKQFIMNNSEEIEYEFTNLSAMSVTLDKQDLEELKQNRNIVYIKENTSVKLAADNSQITKVTELDDVPETERWNINQIGAEKAWVEGVTGKNVDIAIIDTGVSPHKELEVTGGTSTVEYTDNWQDDHGHGTHVAGVIAAKQDENGVVGVAPDANIYAVKALDDNGEGYLGDILEGIDWAITNNMDMINLSLGTEVEDPLLEEIVNEAYQAGILIVGASGNSGAENDVIYPAKYDNVIGVSAVDGRLNIAPFSATGSEVEFSAPGFNILSTSLDNSYGLASGTSQAVPHVTGMLALLKEKYPEMTADELREELKEHTQDLGITGRDPLYGHGFVSYFPDDQSPPNDARNLEIYQTTSESFSVQWENPLEDDFSSVELYLNDIFVGSVNLEEEPVYTFEELEADTEYQLTLYTKDQVGNQSDGVTQVIQTETAEVVKEDFSESTDEAEDNDGVSDEKKQPLENEQKSESENTETPRNLVTVGKITDDTNTDQLDKRRELAKNQELETSSANRSNHPNKNTEDTSETTQDKVNDRKLAEKVLERESPEISSTETTMADSKQTEESALAEVEEAEDKDDRTLLGGFIDFIAGVFSSIFTWLTSLFS